MKKIRLYSDIRELRDALEQRELDDLGIQFCYVSQGTHSFRKMFQEIYNQKEPSLFLFADLNLMYKTSLIKLFLKKQNILLVSLDIILRKSKKTFSSTVKDEIRRILHRNVDYFIHYFRNLEGYRYWGISEENSVYIPFKCNVFSFLKEIGNYTRTEEYVYTAGRSLRDYRTFFEAARITGLPSAFLDPRGPDVKSQPLLNIESRKQQGLDDIGRISSNITVLEDDGTLISWYKYLLRAKIVVVPILPSSLCASGISLYLDAMALGKPVILTRGPGGDDVLTDQAIFVPPNDPQSLAISIMRLWNDHDERETLAAAGLQYAKRLGGTPQLMNRLIDWVVNVY